MYRFNRIVIILLGLFLISTSQSAAQPATPAVPLVYSAYPTLTITISDTGYAVTGSIPAGLVHMEVINATSKVEEAHIFVLHLPLDAEVATVQQQLANPAADLPDWFNGSLVGGPDRAGIGQAVHGIVELTPGTYLVTDPFSGMSTAFTVGPAGSESTPAPADDLITERIDMSEFQYAGLPATVESGDQFWQVSNTGNQPHELAIASIPDGMTVPQVIEALQLDDNSPIPADLQPFAEVLRPTDFTPFAGSQAASTGSTTWLSLHLEPDTTYIAFCFFPDTETNVRHAMEGMVSIFTTST